MAALFNISASVKAYFALKMIGVRPRRQQMPRRARRILAIGAAATPIILSAE